MFITTLKPVNNGVWTHSQRRLSSFTAAFELLKQRYLDC